MQVRKTMKTELLALKGKVYTKSFQLGEGQKVTLGRGTDADIQVLDHGLSRHHCYFEKRGEKFFLGDLESRNGTYVNGQRITHVELKSGDIVRIGAVEFEFKSGPDRRQMDADLIASIPAKPGEAIAERLDVEQSDLMALSPQFQSMENFRRIQRDLATIYKVGNLINAEPDLSSLYNRVLDVILQVVRADRGFLIMTDDSGQLVTVSQREREPGTRLTPASFSRTIAQECFDHRTSVLRADALMDDRYKQADSVLIQHIHSVLCVPVECPDAIVGVIYADTVSDSEVFQKHDLELLGAVGKQAGLAIQRVKLMEQLRRTLRSTVKALAAAIEAKDEYTRGHSERVTNYAMKCGAAMMLTEEQLQTLELASYLHDVGKIGIPESILRKAGPLTQQEYDIVKQHSRMGANIVRNIEGARELADIVLHHHERWDGKGYPDGLKGDQSGLLSRILTVADAYDAMSSQRPYRDRLAVEKVFRTLREAAGRQFDSEVVDAFVRALSEEPKAAEPAAKEESAESHRSMGEDARVTRQMPPPSGEKA